VEALGGSLASIAAAKAGILRPGRPLVTAQQPHAEAEAVLRAEAAARGCPVLAAEEAVRVRPLGLQIRPEAGAGQVGRAAACGCVRRGGSLMHCGCSGLQGQGHAGVCSRSPDALVRRRWRMQAVSERLQLGFPPLPAWLAAASDDAHAGPRAAAAGGAGAQEAAALEVQCSLVGPAQHHNVATAAATVRLLRHRGWALPDAALAEGLARAQLPGRFQVGPPRLP
jgi:folylpolyglutamate synthase/dihydropteroate synthase